MTRIKDSELEYSSVTSQDSGFLIPNGIYSPFEISDIELISIHSLTYTSLKDILPPSPSPMAIASPTHNSSWHEIPIKNPLLKHAAWAYLQPMSTRPESDDRNLFLKLKDKCCCECGFGCFAYIGEMIKGMFPERRESDEDDDDEDKLD